MGLLIDGRWDPTAQGITSESGRFARKESAFRERVTADGSSGFPAMPGRYHLYVAYNCPWAWRTMVFRKLKRLESVITMSVAIPDDRRESWSFGEYPGSQPDSLNGFRYLHEAYTAARPTYTGVVSVPVLWDRERRTIVNNESSEIIRMLNSAFDGVGAAPGDYYPAALRDEIEVVNRRVYETVNNGVYRCGFATSQAAYDEAIGPLFETLDWLESRLATRRYVCGDRLTEADWRLFTTLVRFDPVYHGHFKCNVRRLVDYPNLWAYTRDLYQHPGVAATVDFEHIKRHYYQSHLRVNPSGIVPWGPMVDFEAPHGRE